VTDPPAPIAQPAIAYTPQPEPSPQSTSTGWAGAIYDKAKGLDNTIAVEKDKWINPYQKRMKNLMTQSPDSHPDADYKGVCNSMPDAQPMGFDSTGGCAKCYKQDNHAAFHTMTGAATITSCVA